MTTDYEAAYEAAQKLPLKYQDAIVENILETIEESQWDETLTSPESQAYAEKRRKEVIKEHLSGKTKKYIPGKSIAELFQ
jgi:hypothetical protein